MAFYGMSVYFLQNTPPVFMQFKESEGLVQDLFAFTKYLKYNLMEQMGVGNRILFPGPQLFQCHPQRNPKK